MLENWEDILRKTKTLDSSRILLREFQITDAPDVLEYAGDVEVVRFLDWEGVKTLDEAIKQIEDYYIPTPGVFAMELRSSQKCIGAVVLQVDPEHEKASFGYNLNRAYWNRGYTSEALAVLLDFAFNVLELNRVEARHYRGNEASGRVMKKCGMKFEGIAPEALKIKGVFRDAVNYGVLREDYLVLREQRQ